MKIIFHLSWCRRGQNPSRSFKQKSAGALLSEYVARIAAFATCRVEGPYGPDFPGRSGSRVILCDKNRPSVAVSSEQLADYLAKFQNAGVREVHVVIGGPDGFRQEEADSMNPDLRWAFGPLTLPHELACVIAAEQIYRGYCILNRLPYHRNHD
jgi:23S rRNA (pseudouridine1915-N3)-methyltransferase